MGVVEQPGVPVQSLRGRGLTEGRFNCVEIVPWNRMLKGYGLPMTRTLTVPVELPASVVTRLGFGSSAELAADLRVTLAVRLFEEGRLSLGKAAELASMHKADFMDELGRRKVSVFNWDDVEIEREFGAANA